MNKLEEVWFKGDWLWGENWILCDQLAMIAALYPESVLKSTDHVATVELAGHSTRGMMVLDKRADKITKDSRKNVTIIEKLDVEKLMDCIYKALS